MSNILMKVLIAEYFIIMLACLSEGRFMFGMYWAGAIILNMAVILGME